MVIDQVLAPWIFHGRDIPGRDNRIYTAKEENREVAQVLIHQVSWEPDHL